jgi:penicillin-binding protein 2
VGYGFIPDSKYYDKIYGKGSWNSVTVISLGIGQGEIGQTPLQMANSMAVIANRGYYITPHFVRRIEDDTSSILDKFKEKHVAPIDKKWFEPIVQGMFDVVTGGTGRVAQIPGTTVGGKTGTAQNPHGKDHSLFIAIAPVDSPKIAIAVIVENSGFGATYGAPIASLMMEKYLNDTISKSRKPLEQRMFDADLIGKKNVIYDGNRR